MMRLGMNFLDFTLLPPEIWIAMLPEYSFVDNWLKAYAYIVNHWFHKCRLNQYSLIIASFRILN
ncbi:hypothetical protein D3C73_604590 [compost metagenome]